METTPEVSPLALPLNRSLVPYYPIDWVLHVVSGPQDGPEFITSTGRERFFTMPWVVSTSSNRLGIRLSPGVTFEGGNPILWARQNGGEGGSHPSNILDNAYARAALNINGDTPVILGCDGPDMGGFVCVGAIIQADV